MQQMQKLQADSRDAFSREQEARSQAACAKSDAQKAVKKQRQLEEEMDALQKQVCLLSRGFLSERIALLMGVTGLVFAYCTPPTLQ